MFRKHRLLKLMALLMLAGIFACSQETRKPEKVVAVINGCEVTHDEVLRQLKAEVDTTDDYKLTRQSKDNFLDYLIQKQVLIQEAKRLKLDTKEKFISAMERYWESVLIRDLMEIKGNEILSKAIVSEEEIETRYRSILASGRKLPPLKDSRPLIASEIREERKTRLLKEWVDDLTKRADVKINRELLHED
jgi:predicted transposase YbfD/YdcC